MGCCGWQPPDKDENTKKPKIVTWSGFLIFAVMVGIAIIIKL